MTMLEILVCDLQKNGDISLQESIALMACVLNAEAQHGNGPDFEKKYGRVVTAYFDC